MVDKEDSVVLEKERVLVECIEVGPPDEINVVETVNAIDSGSCVLAAEVAADPVAPSLELKGCA
jgi:hypothetical protein